MRRTNPCIIEYMGSSMEYKEKKRKELSKSGHTFTDSIFAGNIVF